MGCYYLVTVVISIYVSFISDKSHLKANNKMFDQRIVILFSIVSVFSITSAIEPSIAECGDIFEKKCICGHIDYDNERRYVVNCTNAGFQNTNVLEKMPQQVEVVIFTGNYLQLLPWNIFGTINEYPNLRIIDMSNNHIREIRGKTYHHVQQVERLILNHNNLSISSADDEFNHLHPRIFSNFINLRALHLTNAFADFTSFALSKDLHSIFVNSNLTKLNRLHLEQNEISKFKDRQVFCDLPQLQDLHLGDNNLKEINFNVTCLQHLRFLDLERNRLETLTQNDIEKLELLNDIRRNDDQLIIDLNRNPFPCDCSIFEFVKWIRATNIVVRNRERLFCTSADDSVEQLLKFSFKNCAVRSMEHTTTSTHEATLVFLLVVLLFVLIGLIGALVYVSKERIKYFISPVVSSRKVHYTSIRDDDNVPEVHL